MQNKLNYGLGFLPEINPIGFYAMWDKIRGLRLNSCSILHNLKLN